MNAQVEAIGVRKSYTVGRNTIAVLRGADLAVAPGETVAIVGKSGAGKSTLLHLLGGLDHPDAGEVRVEGRDLRAMTRRELALLRAGGLGFVFQSYHLLPEMDVLENVMLPALALRGAWRAGKRARARAESLLEAVGLTQRATHTPMELSGGEQQRVALARALMNEPRIVLADEPTGNLDEATGHQVLDLLFRLVREKRRTLIVVTHNEHVAAACHRTLKLTDGALK
jgi:predicted ABC-type transport system involved in lysophospholipase L1 biosynthesis ATPase subunit